MAEKIFRHKKIKFGSQYIDAFQIKLLSKNFILLRGTKGYIMCGYLNLSVANKFREAAVKISGVSNIEDALEAKVLSLSYPAQKMGIYKGQPVKKALKIIA